MRNQYNHSRSTAPIHSCLSLLFLAIIILFFAPHNICSRSKLTNTRTSIRRRLSSFPQPANFLDGRLIAPSIVCPPQDNGGNVFGVMQSDEDANEFYFVCTSGLYRIRDDRQLVNANGTTEVQQIIELSESDSGVIRIVAIIQYNQTHQEEKENVREVDSDTVAPTRLIALNSVSYENFTFGLELVEYLISRSGNLTQQSQLAIFQQQQTLAIPFRYRDAIYITTTDSGEGYFFIYEWNCTTQSIRQITQYFGPQLYQVQTSYDHEAERIIITFTTQGISIIQLPIGANVTLPILPEPFLNLSQCPSPMTAIRCDSQLVAVCNADVYSWSLVNDSIVTDSNATLLLASNDPTSICQIESNLIPSFVWNSEEQTLYMSCGGGAVSSVIIQWTPLNTTTSVTPSSSSNPPISNVIVTPLISPSVCTTVLFILIDRRDSSVWLKCLEGLFQTLGRSLNILYSSSSLGFQQWLFIDQTRHLTFFYLNGDVNSTIVRTDGTNITLANTCQAQSIAYDQTEQSMWILCQVTISQTFQLARMNLSESQYGQTVYNLSQPINWSSMLYLLRFSTSVSLLAQSIDTYGNFFLSIYTSDQEIFTHLPFLINGERVSNLTSQSNLRLLLLQSLPMTDRILMVLSNNTLVSSQTEVWIMRLVSNTSAVGDSDHLLEVLSQYLTIGYLYYQSLACDTQNEILFLCTSDTLIRIDLNTSVSETFIIPMISLNMYCNYLAFDQKHHQVVLAQSAMYDLDGTSNLIMFDDMTRTFAIGIYPQLTSTPSVASIAVIEDSRQIMLAMLRDEEQPFQLITITQRWTCFPGTSWTVNGLCEACPVGKSRGFVDFDNATIAIPQCQICPLGSIAPSTGSSECQTCATGRFADYNLGQVCSPCGLGYYSNETGSTSCQPCAVGRYANLTLTVECTQCEIGRYSSSSGSAGCNFCEPGKNQSSKGQTSCSDCLAGTYTPDIGYGECKECDAGFYSDQDRSSVCFPCSGGTASNQTGLKTQCPSCPPGTESKEIGGKECRPCDLGSFSFQGSACEPCAVNTYSPQIGAECVSCTSTNQRGLHCEFGLATVEPGWWAYLQYDETLNASIYRTTQCPDDYCPGSLLQPPGNLSVIYCDYPRLNSHDNWLCAECVEGHIAWGSSCEPCTHANGGLIFLLLMIAFCIVFFLLRSNSAAGPLTILVFFLQISALELGPVRSYIDWIQFANLGTHSTRSCILPITPIQQKILTLFVPVILFIVLGVVGTTHCTLDRFWTASPDHILPLTFISRIYSFIYIRTRNFTIDRYIGVVQAILIFSYTSITATVVQSLHCVEVAPGINRLFSTPQIDCQTNEYRHHLLPFAYIWLIVYVIGFPLAMLTFLWRHRPIIDYISNGGATGPSDRPIDGLQLDLSLSSVQAFDLRWAHFFRPYRSVVWYWQPIAMLRRLVFALISVLLIESPTSKNVMYSFVGFTSLMLHLQAQPFHSVQLNFLEDVSYSLLICISFLLTSQVPPWSSFVPVMLFLLVVPFALGLVIFVFRASYMKMKAQGDSIVDHVSFHSPPPSSSSSSSSFQQSPSSHRPPTPVLVVPVSSPSDMIPSSAESRRPLLFSDSTFLRATYS